ncbi:MAG: aminopeptidase P family protein [Acidobacteria bacterium]|nr:aminopeptidase P family protein [Acidobacteriota bacterium]
MHKFRLRFQRFLRSVHRSQLDAFLITHPPHLRYLFNFSGSLAWACCMEGETTLLVDSRYIEEAERQSVNCRPLLVEKSFPDSLRELFRGRPPLRVGIEASRITHQWMLDIRKSAPRMKWRPVTDLLEELRQIKERSEIELLEKAFAIGCKAYRRLCPKITPGMRETEVAGLLEFEMRREGGEGTSFETIVASGPRSSLPHGSATKKRLRKGELVLIDFGLHLQGYGSDLTRVHFMEGAVRPEIYDIVRKAQEQALAAIRPGVRCCEVDAAARNFIQSRGYGNYFGHSTGHGLGLEVHEMPRISRSNLQELRPGMVFTVEPGIYIPGKLGVRIEDAVVVTTRGYRLLSRRQAE